MWECGDFIVGLRSFKVGWILGLLMVLWMYVKWYWVVIYLCNSIFWLFFWIFLVIILVIKCWVEDDELFLCLDWLGGVLNYIGKNCGIGYYYYLGN